MTIDNMWEYQDHFYKFPRSPLVEGSFVTKEIWDTWESIAFELMRADLNSGWQVDQSFWGPFCIKYEKRRVNLLSRSVGAWVIYILLSLVKWGIGFLIIPLFMFREFMQFKGIEVRLMRKK